MSTDSNNDTDNTRFEINVDPQTASKDETVNINGQPKVRFLGRIGSNHCDNGITRNCFRF